MPKNNGRIPSSPSSSSSSSERDSDEDVLEDDHALFDTSDKHDQFLKVLPLIIHKHPEIYQRKEAYFSRDGDASLPPPPAALSRRPQMTVKELIIKNAVHTGESSEEEGAEEDEAGLHPSIVAQREAARHAFVAAAAQSEEEDEDDGELFVRSKRQPQPAPDRLKELKEKAREDVPKDATELVASFWDVKSNKSISEGDRFLRDYILNERWKGGSGPAYDPKLDEEDEEEVRRMEDFEQDFAFRHQHPDAAKIASFPRTVAESLRKPNSKRKEKRERKKERDAKRKAQMEGELKKMRKSARTNIERKLSSYADQQNEEEQAQEQEQEHEQEHEHEKNTTQSSASSSSTKPSQRPVPRTFRELVELQEHMQATGAARNDFQSLIDEYYNLDYEDVLEDGTTCRFKYAKVEPVTGGLTIDEIFDLDDEELEHFAPLRYLAPYRTEPVPARFNKKNKYKHWKDSRNKKPDAEAEEREAKRKFMARDKRSRPKIHTPSADQFGDVDAPQEAGKKGPKQPKKPFKQPKKPKKPTSTKRQRS